MNTRHAQLILTILQEGSFTAAAKALQITQPTLSQTVKQIEGQLGEPIFVRGKSPVTLTPAGTLYIQAARKFLLVEEQLNEELSVLHGKTQGVLRIGLLNNRSDELLPQVLSQFYAAYPGIHMEVIEASANVLEQKLLRNELHMATLRDEAHLPQLTYRQIASEEMVLLAGKRTAIAQRIPSGSTISMRDAQSECFVLPYSHSDLYPPICDILARNDLRPSSNMRCDNINTAMRVCAACDYVMLSPFITFLCDSGMMQKLSHYHLSCDAYLPPFYMAHPRDLTLPSHAEMLFTLLCNRFRAMTAYRP